MSHKIICTKCNKKKIGKEFSKDARTKSGLRVRCKMCTSAYDTLRRTKIKETVFNHYGHNCRWPNCKVTDLDMLSLDHILDGGYEDRKKEQQSYWLIIKHRFPEKFQVLCMNHQFKKRQMKYRGEKLPAKVTTL